MHESAKIVFVGDLQVGKTSIINQYMNISHPTSSTVGANSVSCQVVLPNAEVNLQIWDTAGQEQFKSLVPVYARGAQLAIVVFDVTAPDSLTGIRDWIKYLEGHVPGDHPIVVGNKADQPMAVSTRAINDLCQEFANRFFLTSALTGEGIEELFAKIARVIADGTSATADLPPKEISIVDENRKTEGGSDCC
jgi:small GTP-binding protein